MHTKMKKTFILILAITVFGNCYSQKFGDSEINVTLSDSTIIYEKVANAFKKSGFTLKDEDAKDTLTTYLKSMFNPFGYIFLKAVLTGNTVTLKGWWKQTAIGGNYENKEDPKIKEYTQIIYFYNSSTWRIMNRVAQDLKNDKIENVRTQRNIPSKSKEDRLRELKDFFEKELITKEEYERAKQKILDEQ